ncbi:hypothetical protein LTR36_005254 [Oleoguttula mirabilis]|uniref:Uncharacterized protein n=1 Tax=Oleoguttula mirabilis TaxID=1507867 RepID=A0AAV9JW74_9PEZI|nr:hypothetical protein LTR36_005254 [Oleoguttula mirabilis]
MATPCVVVRDATTTSLNLEDCTFNGDGSLRNLLELFVGVTDLGLAGLRLTSEELCEALEGSGTSVQRVSLRCMVSSDGQWRNILQTVKAMQLVFLELESTKTKRPDDGIGWLGGTQRVNKALRGPKGIEQFWITEGMARMYGGKAVEAGLEVILGRIGGQ